MNKICDKIKKIMENIEKAKLRGGFNHNVKLIAVSKTFPSERIREVYNCGIADFGENYAQEMLKKQEELKDLNIRWHFIGHLQKNKAKYIYNRIEYLHSLDSIELAEILNKKLKKDKIKLKVLIQINIGNEPTKYGILKEEIDEFIEQVKKYEFLLVKGFMCIPPIEENIENTRKYFKEMRKIFEKYKNDKITELSMGMSSDYEIAVEEGATMVRIGTLIFGRRDYK